MNLKFSVCLVQNDQLKFWREQCAALTTLSLEWSVRRENEKKRSSNSQFNNPGTCCTCRIYQLMPDLGTTTILTSWDCCTKDDTEPITQFFDRFCLVSVRYEWRRQYRESVYKGFDTWVFSYDYQAEILKHSELLQKWRPSLMENLPISEGKRQKNMFNFKKTKPNLDAQFSNDP